MKRIFSLCLSLFALLIGIVSPTAHNAVDAGICDFGGQGRNQYGK